MPPPTDLPILPFASQQDWEDWLRLNADEPAGIWLQIAKKAAGLASVTYDEALEVALCFGWIDGQRKTFDERYFIQRFTPRRPRSPWSKRNVGIVGRLVEAGRMEARGLREVEAAKADGRWASAYGGIKDAKPHPELLAALAKSRKAKAFLQTLSRRNQGAVYIQVQDAKREETRKKRIERLVAMLEAGRGPFTNS